MINKNKQKHFPGLIIFLILSVLFFSQFIFSQIAVNSPAGREDVKSCSDYSDESLLDKWDMNERTDLGWAIFNTVELPKSNLTNISFQGGIFSGTSVYTPGGSANYSDANIVILDTAYPSSAKLGKVGSNFPIDANKYTFLAMRMYIEPDVEGPTGQILWAKNTLFGGVTTSGPFYVHNNWYIYLIDIPSLGIAAGADPWNGLIDYLRIDPIMIKDKTIQIDWIRLVEYDMAEVRTITWTGNPGNVDIYLDNDSNPSNGNLGMLAKNVGGNSYSFLAGSLMSGDYYVAVAPTGTTNYSYSFGYYHINDVPVLNLDKPSDEGSDSDYVTVNFSDPWDMNNQEDIEHTVKIMNGQFANITYEDRAGNTFTNQSVFYGESEPALPGKVGDPEAFFLHFLWRGGIYPIDTSKYHNLVFKMGIAGAHSTNDGSVARAVWRKMGETVENVSQDIIIRHLPGKWIMHKVVCDLSSLPLEDGAGSPSHSGWTGQIDSFRIDPHEFSSSRAFFFDDVKITADWSANTSFTIEWTLSDSDNNPTLSLYYDTDKSGYDGTLIVGGLSCSPGQGSYFWDTTLVAEGKYWIYAIIDDGQNQNRCYARGPLFINHDLVTEIALSKNRIYMGAERNGEATSNEKILITNTGEGTLDWNATSDESWIDVSPSSGIGDGVIEIGIKNTNLALGTYSGLVRVEDSKAWNSPQFIEVILSVYRAGTDSPPFGHFDTPGDGSTVMGSIAVTGWALDDIEATRVEIKRGVIPGDPPGAIGPDGLIYVGDAIFVKGARTDVEAAFPDHPKSDRAGWGYMMLTYGLPNKGNGTFRIYAFVYDTSGHRVLLGEKTIISDNNSNTKPFGAIDTPVPGGTASGSDYVNWGWALTPPPKEIPRDGSTIWVFIDGVPVGHPVYNLPRQIIADLFPGYLNNDGPLGNYMIDTMQYENGTHTIVWSATDDAGETDGIGSRFFEIQNVGGMLGLQLAMRNKKYQEDYSGTLRIEVDGEREIEIEELERIELRLRGEGGSEFLGWGEDRSKRLPIGSTLDRSKGVFYWIPGPGFLGKHVLHFAVSDGMFMSKPIKITVNIVPRKYFIKGKIIRKESLKK